MSNKSPLYPTHMYEVKTQQSDGTWKRFSWAKEQGLEVSVRFLLLVSGHKVVQINKNPDYSVKLAEAEKKKGVVSILHD